jgi:hypothetical protein
MEGPKAKKVEKPARYVAKQMEATIQKTFLIM